MNKRELDEMTYTELERHLAEVVATLRTKAYASGYAQGKVDAQVESDKPVGRLAVRSPQEIRDDIVERAKAEVTKLLGNKPGDSSWERYGVTTKFYVNAKKRAVTAIRIGNYSEKIHGKGIAKCAPDDCFNVHIGKAIALRRALGLEVPAEYLEAPKPTEVRVGDVIERRGIFADSRGLRTVKSIEDSIHFRGKKFYRAFDGLSGTDEDNVVRIVDDSREISE